jgi:hypothetical protein
LESNQVNQIRHEDGDGHHLSSSPLEVLYCCLNLFYDIPYFCFVMNLRLFCTSFYTDVVILICHLLPIRLYLIRSWKCVVP